MMHNQWHKNIDQLSETWEVDRELIRSKFQGTSEDFLDALGSFALFHSWEDCISALDAAWKEHQKTWSVAVLQSAENFLCRQSESESEGIMVHSLRDESHRNKANEADIGMARSELYRPLEGTYGLCDERPHCTDTLDTRGVMTQPADQPKMVAMPAKETPIQQKKGRGLSRQKVRRTKVPPPEPSNYHSRVTRSSVSQHNHNRLSIDSPSAATCSQPLVTLRDDALNRVLQADGWISEAVIFDFLQVLQAALGKSRLQIINSLADEDSIGENFGKEMILAPIQINHKSNRHWTLVIIEPSRKLVRILDSMPSPDTISTVSKLILDFCRTIKLEPTIHFSSPMLQLRANDCGVFILIYALQICADADFPQGQANTIVWRRLIRRVLEPLTDREMCTIQSGNPDTFQEWENMEPRNELPTVDLTWLNEFMLSEVTIDAASEMLNQLRRKMNSIASSWQAIIKEEMDELAEHRLSSGHWPSVTVFRTLRQLAVNQLNTDLDNGMTQEGKEAALRFNRVMIYLQDKTHIDERLHKLTEISQRIGP